MSSPGKSSMFCDLCGRGPLFSWEKNPQCTGTICIACNPWPKVDEVSEAAKQTAIGHIFDALEYATGIGLCPDIKPWGEPEEADSNSLRCCHGIGEPPRCRMKATHIPVYANGVEPGAAYCRDHVPVKKKGSWYVPLRCVVVER